MVAKTSKLTLCAERLKGERLKGEPILFNYGSQGKSQAQLDGGEGHSVIIRNVDKKEVIFFVTVDNKPRFAVEVTVPQILLQITCDKKDELQFKQSGSVITANAFYFIL